MIVNAALIIIYVLWNSEIQILLYAFSYLAVKMEPGEDKCWNKEDHDCVDGGVIQSDPGGDEGPQCVAGQHWEEGPVHQEGGSKGEHWWWIHYNKESYNVLG